MQGESQVFVEKFYQQQHEVLLRYLCRRLGSLTDAYDVAQQTYEKLLKADQFSHLNNPKAFVFRMATNIATDTLRKRVVRGEHLDLSDHSDETISDNQRPDESLEIEQTLAMIRLFIAELPPKCRVAFLCYKFEERSYEDIARVLGVSESMVRKYVLRAMVYCKDRMQQCWGENALTTALHKVEQR